MKKLRDWNELTEEVTGLPNEVALSLMSGRPELLVVAGEGARQFSLPEQLAIVNLCRVLFDTNRELQRHSEKVAQLAEQALGHIKGLTTTLQHLELFAAFSEDLGAYKD